MVNEAYLEVMVTRKTNPAVKVGQLVTAALTVFCVLLALMGFGLMLIGALLFGVASYVLGMYIFVEYEYTYVDKELQIDRILGKSKRKRMATLDLLQMEAMAPLGSHQLGGYQSTGQKTLDYSSKEERQPEERYLLCMKDGQYILEPGEQLVKILRNSFPRKIFTY